MGRKSKTIEDRRVSVGVTLPYHLVRHVDNVAQLLGVTRTNVVEIALQNYLSCLKEEGVTYAASTASRI